MAHVLPQQRNNPPYLMIGSILLFLVAAVLAVVFYVKYDKQTKALAEAQTDANKARTDVRTAKTDVESLVELITGRKDKSITAATAGNDAKDALNTGPAKNFADAGLAKAIRGLNDVIAADAKTIDDLKGQESNLTKQIETMQQERQTQGAQREADVAKNTQDMEAAKAEVRTELTAQIQRLEQTLKDKDTAITEKDKQLAEMAADNEKKTRDLQVKDTRVEELTKTIREFKGGKGKPTEAMLRQRDGRIVKISPDLGVVYIDLGQIDKIEPGMTFSVYSVQTGIPDDGKGKAKLLVKNVSAGTSECAVTESSHDDPLAEGDIVANIAFSPTRTYSFVVEGDFDVYNEGHASPQGNRMIRNIVEQMGGHIMDKLTVDTDFVVMGEEPSMPSKPAADAPQTDVQIYKEKLAAYERYAALKTAAASLQVPVLNTSRFLAFTGSIPKKSLTEH